MIIILYLNNSNFYDELTVNHRNSMNLSLSLTTSATTTTSEVKSRFCCSYTFALRQPVDSRLYFGVCVPQHYTYVQRVQLCGVMPRTNVVYSYITISIGSSTLNSQICTKTQLVYLCRLRRHTYASRPVMTSSITCIIKPHIIAQRKEIVVV